MYNRSTQIAITAMSRLAEAHLADAPALTAAQIAEGTPYSRPFIAKVLTTLSQHGLVQGTSGRRGGYTLARPPAEISLLDIARCFERRDRATLCPFSKGVCQRTAPCPLHAGLTEIWQHQQRFLAETHLDVFLPTPPEATGNRTGDTGPATT